MKILSKQDIHEHKAVERKKEIDEGVKLAKRVDDLRELTAKEKANLDLFRSKSLVQLHTEISNKAKERDKLDKDILEKQIKRRELEAPIDLTSEWKKLELNKKQIENIKVELRDRETQIITREIAISGFEQREKDLVQKEQQAHVYLAEATNSYTKTEDIRSEIEVKKKQTDKDIENEYKILTEKEHSLIEREFVVNNTVKKIDEEKKNLLNTHTQLIDREALCDTRDKDFRESNEKLKERENYINRLHIEASNNHDISEITRKEAEKFNTESNIEIENRLSTVIQREANLEVREREYRIGREQLEIEKQHIEKEKLHIASQQETLRTAWISIKKLQK